MDLLETLRRRAVVGHRGYPARELENTLQSIEAAIAHGADAVEVDVQVTADGVAVLSHDDTLERTFGLPLNVRQAAWEEVKKVERGRYRVPTLREALELVAERVGVLVEVKHPEDAHIVARTIREAGAARWTAVISFHEEALRGVDLYRGLIYAKPPGRVVDAKRLGCHIVLPHHALATERAVALAHKMGLYVVAWTVNSPATARRLWEIGVDGVATDDVENIKAVLS
ncbi:glycerophosphodiester phosphodiesterase [Pyrobaculum neutrophilum]|uniref:Glycerophosphoryl diester phosphodiesterase n=1 Tax=Pyrobaculum neutrophilum (strain DSM 2338 / JCM 9278 / NBRC 100436 / V24Sta) TaxID=444157 RepID=B1YAR5_PYRNV|nr:glycerophosphodiester phosphodiesterase [Pyrobaculum neutrophilum]ACB39144.1 glycerophosphoryl diester phosphodiesterase [Pyrobaculum neutrophilum V24Sta]